MVQIYVEMCSVEKEGLVRYTRRLEGVFIPQRAIQRGRRFRVQIDQNFLHLHITRTRHFPPNFEHTSETHSHKEFRFSANSHQLLPRNPTTTIFSDSFKVSLQFGV